MLNEAGETVHGPNCQPPLLFGLPFLRDSINGFALHPPPAQADNPLGDPRPCPEPSIPAEPDLGSQRRARVACRSSGGRIASNERAMQES
jgi:hypothetical protein